MRFQSCNILVYDVRCGGIFIIYILDVVGSDEEGLSNNKQGSENPFSSAGPLVVLLFPLEVYLLKVHLV